MKRQIRRGVFETNSSSKITKMNFLKIGQTCQNLRKKSIIPNTQKKTIL